MATCLETINALVAAGQIPAQQEVFPNTQMPFTVNSTTNRIFRLSSPQFQTVRFAVNLVTNPYSVTFTFYNFNGAVAIPVGSVSASEASTNFTFDFPPGDYLICVRTTSAFAQTGQFVAQFTGYAQNAFLAPTVSEGQSMSMVFADPIRPPKDCDEALFFKIIEGTLPPNLSMDSLGTITGVLPNLDCLPDRLSPAVNWYYDENDGSSHPWGREWRFKVRVWVAGMEAESFDEEWFCVRIYNNWSLDLENFIAQAPFRSVEAIRVVEQPEKLTVQCEPCKSMEQVIFVPQVIEQPECEACTQPNQAANVELIEIPVQLSEIAPNDFLIWYDQNKNIPQDNQFIQKFMDDLEDSDAFQILRARAGYVAPERYSPRELEQQFVAASNYQNYLQLAVVRLDPASDPNSLQQLMKQWKDYENQVLPTTGFAYTGTTMEITLG